MNPAQIKQPARRLKFTQLAIERLRPPESDRVIYWDTILTGFGLRVSAKGRKTWLAVYRVDGKQIWDTIGTTARVPSLADARERARQRFEDADRGVNPVEARRPTTAAPVATTAEAVPLPDESREMGVPGAERLNAITFSEAVERYINECQTKSKPDRPNTIKAKNPY